LTPQKKPEDFFGFVAIKQETSFFKFEKKNIIGFVKLFNVIDEIHVILCGQNNFRGISVGETLLIVVSKKLYKLVQILVVRSSRIKF